MEIYLQPTFTIDANHKRIIEAAQNEIQGSKSNKEKAVKLFYFVRDSIQYNIYMISVFKDDFMASRILDWGKGYCVQKAVLLTALGRAAGIPTRLAFAKIKNHRVPAHVIQSIGTNTFPRHGYNQFFLNGRWVSATATFHRDMCAKYGLPTVEFDGGNDAILPEKDLKGEPYIEYIEKYGARDDLPFNWVVERISKVVGPNKRPWLHKDRDRMVE